MHKPKKNIEPSEHEKKIKSTGDLRRQWRENEYEKEKQAILSVSRSITEQLHLRGIGNLRLQVIYIPSFESGFVWDIREIKEGEKMIRNVYESNLEDHRTILPGYLRLAVDNAVIERLLSVINETTITLRLDSTNRMGLDGVAYGLNVFNDLYREIRLRWWSDVPDHLVVLDKAVKDVINVLKNVKEKASV